MQKIRQQGVKEERKAGVYVKVEARGPESD
jgi:hypothetical protein